jgi:hypothetical protein
VSGKVFLSPTADKIHPTNCILNPDLLERNITTSITMMGKLINPTEWLLKLNTLFLQEALLRHLYIKNRIRQSVKRPTKSQGSSGFFINTFQNLP